MLHVNLEYIPRSPSDPDANGKLHAHVAALSSMP